MIAIRTVALTGLLMVFPGKSGGQVVFRSGVDLTTLAVTLTDKKGNLLTDVGRDDFEVIEDGKRQTMDYFANGDGETAPAMHLGLMVDASGSMQADMKLAQSAAIEPRSTCRGPRSGGGAG